MNRPNIHIFRHAAMATEFQVRLADQEQAYAEQAAEATFTLLDRLEARLSRFRSDSDIAMMSRLAPGESLRVTEPTLACLLLAQRMEAATGGAFSVAAAARQKQPELPRCAVDAAQFTVQCISGRLDFDLGAIGKGFALDRMAALLADWDCPAHLLVSGGSSILAGQSPVGLPGWSCGLGEDNSAHRFWLVNASVGGSGLAVKGEHILDPRTGGPAPRQRRAWALADTAAESDALSTACMVLDREEVAEVVAANPQWLAILDEPDGIQYLGERPPPARV